MKILKTYREQAAKAAPENLTIGDLIRLHRNVYMRGYTSVWSLYLKCCLCRKDRITHLKAALQIRQLNASETRKERLRALYRVLNRIEKRIPVEKLKVVYA